MAFGEVILPRHPTYNFGVGMDRLSGSAANLVVNPIPIPPLDAAGTIHSFAISRVSTTQDLQRSLGIDLSASYGCASFGAGASGRFGFAQQSGVHAESLFMTITSTVNFADLSIAECVLAPAAAGVVDRPEVFFARYGTMFARACARGGLFVALLRIETIDKTIANQIEADLHGTYGLFDAQAKERFSEVIAQHNASFYCTVYSEGGPNVQISDPRDPNVLLDLANAWMSSITADPNTQAVPYEWTFAPVTIAEGPTPLNTADIQHAQDVLIYCVQERARLLDQLNTLNWWASHQDKYDWSQAEPVGKIIEAVSNTQSDLDLVAAGASAAIDAPHGCLFPADYAKAQSPPKTYPLSTPSPKGPRPLPGTVITPPPLPRVQIPDVTGYDVRVENATQTFEQLGLAVTVQPVEISKESIWWKTHRSPQFGAPDLVKYIIQTIPSAGTMVAPLSSVLIQVPGNLLP